MEVASPLTLAPGAAGAKRSLVCSPSLMDSVSCGSYSAATGMDLTMDDSNQRTFKRRRYNADATMETENVSAISPFKTSAFHLNGKSIFSPSSAGRTVKRCRAESMSPVQANATNELNRVANELNRVVEAQAAEIDNLKTAKSNLEAAFENLKGDHEKVLHENRILKRAVTIQQERQTHAARDLEAARQFKVNADEQIRRLEQMILSLRYHLQTQQSHPGNDFMGFPPQPPDVY